MKKEHGFTLIELLTAITVLAVLLGIGVPSFQTMIQENRSTTAANELLAALSIGRSEAITRNRTVLVCRRNTAGTACANGTDWSVGWAISDQGTILRVWDGPAGNPTITGPTAGITFTSSGALSGLNTEDFCIDLEGSSSQRTVTVVPGGAHYAKKAACS